MDQVTTGELVQIISGGGLAAFAAAVWFELRAQRQERADSQKLINEALTETRALLSAVLERLRIDSGPVRVRRHKTGPVELVDSED